MVERLTVTTVVFDVGNVLIRWDPMNLYRKMFAQEAQARWFIDTICTMDWNLEQDRGRAWREAVATLSAQHPDWAQEIAAYDTRWAEMLDGAIAGSAAILETLKARGEKVYAITNFSAEKWPVACGMFPFLTLFDGVIVSGDERLLKPDPAIYARLMDRHGLAPERCIFVDDSLKNVEGARAVGMSAHHFTDAASLAEALRDLGLLTPGETARIRAYP